MPFARRYTEISLSSATNVCHAITITTSTLTNRTFRSQFFICVTGNRWPRIRFHPKLEFGVEAKALSRPATKIRKLVRSLDPKKFFCRFYVLTDSYNIYVAARRTVTRQKLLAGWEPQPDTWVFTTSVPGVELGPPRPKPPPPKTPPPPRKPADVID